MGAPRVSGPVDMSHPPCDCFDEPDGCGVGSLSKNLSLLFLCRPAARGGGLSILSGL